MSKYIIKGLPGQLHGTVATTDITISGSFPTPLPLVPLRARKDFVLQNNSAVDIYLGGANVTQHDGLKVSADGVFGVQLGRADMYAITAGTTVSGIRLMEVA